MVNFKVGDIITRTEGLDEDICKQLVEQGLDPNAMTISRIGECDNQTALYPEGGLIVTCLFTKCVTRRAHGKGLY